MADVGHSGSQPLPDNFFLALTSDASGDTFPENRLTHFHVQLAEPLYLGDAEWECGMAEVIWPHLQRNNHPANPNWSFQVGTPFIQPQPLEDDARVSLQPPKNGGPAKPPPVEADVSHIFRAPNPPPRRKGRSAPESGTEKDPSRSGVVASPPEASPPTQENPQPALKRSRRGWSVSDGAHGFFYCDLIRPSLCSDFKGKCLRIVPVNRKSVRDVLYPVYYHAVDKRVISTIFVEVKDKYAEYLDLPASEQPMVVVLHFKRVAVSH